MTKSQFAALIAAYKIQNPVKYAYKEAALLKTLDSLPMDTENVPAEQEAAPEVPTEEAAPVEEGV